MLVGLVIDGLGFNLHFGFIVHFLSVKTVLILKNKNCVYYF